MGFWWFGPYVQKSITFDSEKLFPSGLKQWINGNVDFEDKKIGSKKCHGILFLEFAENQSISTCTFSMYTATPNHDAESWAPNDCTVGLSYPHSIRMPKEFVETASIFFRRRSQRRVFHMAGERL